MASLPKLRRFGRAPGLIEDQTVVRFIIERHDGAARGLRPYPNHDCSSLHGVGRAMPFGFG